MISEDMIEALYPADFLESTEYLLFLAWNSFNQDDGCNASMVIFIKL
ncbi:MAG: hypothetical protein QG666_570 [Euryarchaeota archaeon]|nr:hypothetical protein [Euryarchaeota archaeon]